MMVRKVGLVPNINSKDYDGSKSRPSQKCKFKTLINKSALPEETEDVRIKMQ